MLLAVDSSVIIASLVEKEEFHEQCKKLMKKVSDADYAVVAPYTVLVEIVAAIKRRTGSGELAERIGNDLLRMETVYFFELSEFRAKEAAEIARKTGMRGMDSIVVQVAKENNAGLITLDKDMAEKAKTIVKIVEVKKIS